MGGEEDSLDLDRKILRHRIAPSRARALIPIVPGSGVIGVPLDENCPVEFQAKYTQLIEVRASEVPPDWNPLIVKNTSLEMTGIPPPMAPAFVPEMMA